MQLGVAASTPAAAPAAVAPAAAEVNNDRKLALVAHQLPLVPAFRQIKNY